MSERLGWRPARFAGDEVQRADRPLANSCFAGRMRESRRVLPLVARRHSILPDARAGHRAPFTTDSMPTGGREWVCIGPSAVNRTRTARAPQFWTPEARRVLNPRASRGICGYRPSAGPCVDRIVMRFLAPQRPACDCLKIVVSPVRFRASPFPRSACNRGVMSPRPGRSPLALGAAFDV